MGVEPQKWQEEARSDVLAGALLLIGSLRDYVASLETALDLERAKVVALQAQLAATQMAETAIVVVNAALGG